MAKTQYIALPLLEIDNQKAPGNSLMEKLMEDILQISVEESLHLPTMFTLIVKNDYFSGRDEDKSWQYGDLLKIGKSVKIGFQSSNTDAPEFSEERRGYVMEGEITAIETHFTSESQAPVVVRGYDLSHRLHRGRYNRSFQDMTDSDIIKKIAKEVGINVGKNTIDASGAPHEYVFQENQTNMQFFRERAARLGFEVFIQDGELHFRKPKKGETQELKWLRDLHSFRVRSTSAEQVSSVQVRGWDYTKKQEIVSDRNAEQVITQTDVGKGSKTSTAFKGQPPSPKLIVVDRPISSPKEADTLAQALCDELGGEFVCADAKGEGNPKIRPGRIVKLKEMGPYSGEYYVTETRHLFHHRVYTTEFSVRGLRAGNLLTTLAPRTPLEPGQTLLVGIVTNNKDPKGWGRVRVCFPTLTPQSGPDAHESYWARVVGVGAGANRGFDCLPEINDEVLVAFEHGDIHRPYIIGNVWNGKDAPPAPVDDSVQGGKVRLRTLKTRVGHQLQFVEEDKGGSKVGIYIETQGGHKIRINDSDQFVEIETSGGHKLRMSDRDRSITLSSTNTMKITAQTQIEISSPTVKVIGNALVDVKGGIIKLN